MIYREKNNITHCILYDEVEERPLQLLKQLVDKTGAKLVLSSSWRYHYDRTGVNHGHLIKKLFDRLNSVGLSIIDITPRMDNCERGDEIREWLKYHKEVESFIILDDDSDMCEFTEINLIKTTYMHGLLQEHIDKAIILLNKEN